MASGLFIGGRWLDHGTRVANINPSDTLDPLGDYNWGTVADVEAAVAAARAAQPGWAAVLPEARARLLRRVGDELLARADELGRLMAREQGKTVREGRGEVIRSGEIFHFFAGETVRNHGVFTPGLREGFTITVSQEPVGVIGVITPWNLPLSIPAWKIAPALAYGNTVVFKPSELTPDCAFVLTDMLERAGVPAGVFNLVMGNGRDLGPALIDGCDAITFTGSGPTGAAVVAATAGQMKKVQAELGGKSGLVIDKTCELDLAVEVAFQGAFHGTGQRCTASSRIIVLDAVRDAFLDKLLKRMADSRIGHALEEATEIGPVVDQRQLDKDLGYIDIARTEGGEVLGGGSVLERPHAGFYLAPCLIATTNNGARINQEEVFGPVASVLAAHDLDEAIAIANDVHYALSSGICTTDLIAAETFRSRSRAAMVTVNAPTAGLDFHVPFGGRAPSGYGPREQGIAAREFYCEYKSTYVNVSGHL
ncbi:MULTISPECIES: aldehyde dehydrogenase family protein [unclassified Xanthobacter]|uniref:aldehyde dehydrogenase family protein n=1 Tax=unclassified Xanthobacter TaxID=2623496 RepID=UPI001EDDE66B|nr:MULTISPECIES: aldehyde dehydrogenase family protein [unclassified Xanthobacter]